MGDCEGERCHPGKSGRIHRAEDAVEQALSLWEERERARGEILAGIEEAEASPARGEGRVITKESMRELAEEVKKRGRARLAAEQRPSARWCAARQDLKRAVRI